MANSLRAQYTQQFANDTAQFQQTASKFQSLVNNANETYNKSQYVKFQNEVSVISRNAEIQALNALPEEQEKVYQNAISEIQKKASEYGSYVQNRYYEEQNEELIGNYKLSLAKTKATAEAGLASVDYDNYSKVIFSDGISDYNEVVSKINKYTAETGILSNSSLSGKIQNAEQKAYANRGTIALNRAVYYYDAHSKNGTFDYDDMFKYAVKNMPLTEPESVQFRTDLANEVEKLMSQRRQEASAQVDKILSDLTIQYEQAGKTVTDEDKWNAVAPYALYQDDGGNVHIRDEYIYSCYPILQNVNKNQKNRQAQAEVENFSGKSPAEIDRLMIDVRNELLGVNTTEELRTKAKGGTAYSEPLEISGEEAYNKYVDTQTANATITEGGDIVWTKCRDNEQTTYGSEKTYYSGAVEKLAEKLGYKTEDGKEYCAVVVNNYAGNLFFSNPKAVQFLEEKQAEMWSVKTIDDERAWETQYNALTMAGYTKQQLSKAGIFEKSPYMEFTDDPTYKQIFDDVESQVFQDLGLVDIDSADDTMLNWAGQVSKSVKDDLYSKFRELLQKYGAEQMGKVEDELYSYIPDVVQKQLQYQNDKWYNNLFKATYRDDFAKDETITEVMDDFYRNPDSVYRTYFNKDTYNIANGLVKDSEDVNKKKTRKELYDDIANSVYHVAFDELSGPQRETVVFNTAYAMYRDSLTQLCCETFNYSRADITQVEISGIGLAFMASDGIIYFADGDSVVNNKWKISKVKEQRLVNKKIDAEKNSKPMRAFTLNDVATPTEYDSQGKTYNELIGLGGERGYYAYTEASKFIDNNVQGEEAEKAKKLVADKFNEKTEGLKYLESIYSIYGRQPEKIKSVDSEAVQTYAKKSIANVKENALSSKAYTEMVDKLNTATTTADKVNTSKKIFNYLRNHAGMSIKEARETVSNLTKGSK